MARLQPQRFERAASSMFLSSLFENIVKMWYQIDAFWGPYRCSHSKGEYSLYVVLLLTEDGKNICPQR